MRAGGSARGGYLLDTKTLNLVKRRGGGGVLIFLGKLKAAEQGWVSEETLSTGLHREPRWTTAQES